MDRRLALDDEAASQILGFIVGMAVVTSSLAIATYFITTVPDNSPDEESHRLQGEVQRAVEVLATTPGEPEDWEESFDPDQLRRVGLLREGHSNWLDRDKIETIQRGDLTGPRIMESWDLDPTEKALRIEGRVTSVPIGDTPTVDTYGVVHVPHVNGTPLWTPDQDSLEAAGAYSQVNPGYTVEPHLWQFGVDKPPQQALGNTVPDHAWYVETQLFLMMTGIEATYSTADHGTGDWWNPVAVEDALANYTSETGNPESATRWHVMADGAPYGVPGTTTDNGAHVLGVNWRMEAGNADDDEGVGKWRVAEGARSTALLGGFPLGSANTATLSFDQLRRVETDDPNRNVCDEPYHEETETCRAIRPSIIFWNTTAEPDRWTRLAEQGPPDCPASNWNDSGLEQDTSWTTAEVDLCEAVEHSGDKLWVSLFWDTSCLKNGQNTTCQDEDTFKDAKKAPHGWFVDNIQLDIAGKTVYETDFEPPEGTEQQLFVSNGVDHNRTYHPVRDGAEENTVAYLRHAVQNGTSVVALAPDDPTPGDSTPGEWLSQLGLSTRESQPGEAATTDEPDSLLMRFPNDLPTSTPDYERENVSWQTGQPSTPNAWSLPSDFRQLTAVQTAGSDDATMMLGKPYPDGGGVAAIGYNHTSFENETLRQELYENLYPSSVLIDPSFEVGDDLPERGTSEIATDRRVVVVSVTEDDRYVVPLEVTVWLWNRG